MIPKEHQPVQESRCPYQHVAEQIAHRLVTAAIWDGNVCTWTGDEVRFVHGHWKTIHGSVDESLYSGTAGIAVFLAEVWKRTGDARCLRAANRALEQSHWLTSGGTAGSLGLHTGLAGIAFATLRVGQLTKNTALIERGASLANRVVVRLRASSGSPGTDIVDGLAGILVAALWFANVLGEKTFVEFSGELAQRLVASSRHSMSGRAWSIAEDGSFDPALCGMGHGASGVAYALMEYHAATGASEPREIALEGLRYERGWFSRKESNWADIRGITPEFFGQEQPSGVAYPVFWCHGAVGIGLTRLRFYEISKSETFLAEAGAAIHAAERFLRRFQQYRSPTWGYDANFSVCHGLGSIVDLLLYAHRILGVAEYLAGARSIGDQGLRLSGAHQGQWQCGIPNGWEHPGLMLGLAGIGMNYLRLSEPHAVSSIGIMT